MLSIVVDAGFTGDMATSELTADKLFKNIKNWTGDSVILKLILSAIELYDSQLRAVTYGETGNFFFRRPVRVTLRFLLAAYVRLHESKTLADSKQQVTVAATRMHYFSKKKQ